MLGSLSTAGGAECTLEIQESQLKLELFSKTESNLPNVARRASLVCLDSCPVLLVVWWWVCRSSVQAKGVIVVIVTPCGNLDFYSLTVLKAAQPWHLWSWSRYVSVAADVLGEVVVGCVVQGQA